MAETLKYPITHIEKVEIEGLWGKYDVHLPLKKDVNILFGVNGSGKSTILDIIYRISKGTQNLSLLPKSINAVIHYHNNTKLFFSTSKIKKQSDDFDDKARLYYEGRFWPNVGEPVIERNSGYPLVEIKYFDVPISLLKTLDIPLHSKEGIQKLSNTNVKTALDWQIWQLEKKYFSYQINLGKRILEIDTDKIDLKTAKKQVFAKKQQFEQMLNQLFSPTHKTIGAAEDNTILFQFKDGTTVNAYQLSSGEKQLLIILLTVLLQDQQPAILLLDEPETSLHISWQDQLIQLIRSLNPKCQLIIATHSPSIFGKGWHDKIIRMEEVITVFSEYVAV